MIAPGTTASHVPADEQWVVWNGSFGVVDMVTIVIIGDGAAAFLAPPYDMVAPFSPHELLAQGRIVFGECLIMSRQRWQEDQTELRYAAREKRRRRPVGLDPDGSRADREALELPLDGILKPGEINRAFRRLAKSAHPDAGGSSEWYRRIVGARDALLRQFARA